MTITTTNFGNPIDSFNHDRFATLFAQDPQKAIEYSNSFNKPKEGIPTVELTIDNVEKPIAYTIDELKTKLKDNNIKFFPGAKYEQLVNKCALNNLI